MGFSAYGATPLHANLSAGRRAVIAKFAFGLGFLYTFAVISMHENVVFFGLSKAVAVVDTTILGTAETYGVLGDQTVTNTGNTVVTGDLGLSPGTAVTGMSDTVGPGEITGDYNKANSAAEKAQSDAQSAYTTLGGLTSTSSQGAVDLAGQTLTPGVFDFTSSATLTGTLTLSGAGDYVFRTGSTWVTLSGSEMVFTNGADPANVYFQVGSSATLGTYSKFGGTIIATVSITAATGATIDGRLIALGGAVTLDSNTITVVAADTPVDCEGAFGDWTECSKTCGGGKKTREYSIIAHAAHGGSACPHHNGKIETIACNSAYCVHVGLKLKVWENMHGKAGKWRNQYDRLVHVQAGASDKNAAGEYKLDVTHPDATPSSECTLAKSFEAPVDSVHDGGQLIAGNLCAMPACARMLMRRPSPLIPLSSQLPADHRRVHLFSVCG